MKNFNRIWVLIIALNITACGIDEGTLVNNSAAIDEEYVEEVDVEEVCSGEIAFEEDWVEEAWREEFCAGGVEPDQLTSDTYEEAAAVEEISEEEEEEEGDSPYFGGSSPFGGSRQDSGYVDRWWDRMEQGDYEDEEDVED